MTISGKSQVSGIGNIAKALLVSTYYRILDSMAWYLLLPE
jgi:hypothetical protein